MELADFTKPGEKKKLVFAVVLGFVAILFLWWTFIGFGSTKQSAAKPITTSQSSGNRPRGTRPADVSSSPQVSVNDLQVIQVSTSVPVVQEPRRNIFAYWEKPAPPASPTPTPTPTPTPPVLLASISPANVYAKTADFTLEVAGDKFTSEMHVFADERELPTKYKGPQQMSASITAAMIANAGVRQIKVQTPDGRIYSNPIGLSVAPPPTPNYAYVGIWGTPHHIDTALLQDKNNKEILSVQRGDLLSGRFRVTSISEKEVVFVDTNLKIKHTLAMTEGEKTAGSPLVRPTPRVDAEDDEPQR